MLGKRILRVEGNMRSLYKAYFVHEWIKWYRACVGQPSETIFFRKQIRICVKGLEIRPQVEYHKNCC